MVLFPIGWSRKYLKLARENNLKINVYRRMEISDFSFFVLKLCSPSPWRLSHLLLLLHFSPTEPDLKIVDWDQGGFPKEAHMEVTLALRVKCKRKSS